MASNSKLILVTGDTICDNNCYKGNRSTADSSEKRGVRFLRTGGGALLLKDLIEATTAGLEGWKTGFALDSNHLLLPPTYHAFCLWEPQMVPDEKDPSKQFEIWRAVAPPLGYGHDSDESKEDHHCKINAQPIENAAPPEVLVIDDAGIGFRDLEHKDHWPLHAEWQGDNSPRWVVLKLTGSIGEGEFWNAVVNRYAERLIVVVAADQIRRNDVRISRGFSWEATAEDLTAEMNGNPFLQPLLSARHLIVTFRSDAAYWLDNQSGSKSSMLVFDAARAEGEWEGTQGKGAVFGFTSCFTAAVVHELCRTASLTHETSDSERYFEAALMGGLGASRELLRLGHGRVTIEVQNADGSKEDVDNPQIGFPSEGIATKIKKPTEKFVSAPIPQNLTNRGNWMMLDEWQVHARSTDRQRPHYEAAQAVTVLGPAALERFPVARFGDLQTVDRNEIESLRTLRHLISAYQHDETQEKPLSLGIFGPPGAGKSYGVIQIAMAVLKIKKEDILTFNLSQFRDEGDLIGAYHRVRDKALTRQIPLVFWDEFDSRGYHWLQYLLAPMQDGAFQQGQVTHPIGKCVFVFAGATSPTFDTFGPLDPGKLPPGTLSSLASENSRDVEDRWLDFVLKKGPDFKSRLVGYLNVLGPNQRQRWNLVGGRRIWEDDPSDLCCPIRRALFIRSQFKLKDGVRLNIDLGVLRALLETKQYKAGSRSLEFLCSHLRSQVAGSIPRRSHLPGQQLLDMHVDAEAFWKICERDNAYIAMADKVAAALHEGWRDQIKDDPKKQALNVPYAKLPPDKQQANFAQALRIPDILGLAKLHLVPGKSVKVKKLVAARQAEPGEKAVRQIIEDPTTLDVLAEAEHNGWMVERMLAGIKYGRDPDPNRKTTHNLLIPYSQLKDSDKDYDRHTIAGHGRDSGGPERFGYVDLVKIAGFRVARIPEPADATP